MSASGQDRRGSRSPAVRLRAGEFLHALFVKMPAPAEVELAGHVGFDAVILDTEHGPGDSEGLAHHLRAADAVGIPALVRIPAADPAAILAALDAGAAGIVVPHVGDEASARRIVAAAHYPPQGERGLALTTRAGRYGRARLADHLADAERDTLVIVQIEDGQAVARAPKILGVEGVDAVLIGATDLSISLGHPGSPGHHEVQQAIAAILSAAVETGTVAGTVVADADASRAWQAQGGRLSVFVSTQLVGAALAKALDPVPRPAAVPRPRSRVPLVLLPGMLASPDVWTDVATVLVAENAGTARPARIDLDDTVAEMAETVLATAPPRFALAGHSLGGIAAMEIVRRAPHRVTALALLNTSARPASADQLTAWSAWAEQVRARGLPAVAWDLAAANLPSARRREVSLLQRQVDMARRVGRLGFERQLSAQATRPDSRPTLGTFACPTLIVSGAEDDVCPPELQEELDRGIPDSTLVIIPGCGHMSPIEAPAAVAEALADWLNRA